MAGESARQVAQKRREKAARLNRVADACEKGAAGERQTAHALVALPVADWFVLEDVRWPGKRFANIDHVVIGPGGVFVIDSKAWSGVVEVRDGVLRQNGRQREPTVASAADAAMAVAGQVPGLDPHAAKPVLCFVGDHQIAGWARDVMLCTPANLVSMLLSRPRVLDDRAVRRTLLALQEALKAATSPPVVRHRPARPRVSRPARGRGTAGRAPLGRRLLGFMVTVVLMLVAVSQLPWLTSALSHEIVSGVTRPPSKVGDVHRLGNVATLPAGTHRPPLRVRADRAGTAHRVGTAPYLFEGNRFFAVRLEITNVGKRPWVSQPGTTAKVLDTDNLPHQSEGAMRIREGRVLPETLRLAPGQMARGYVVFQVAAALPVTSFSLTVGPGRPRTATWSIDLQ